MNNQYFDILNRHYNSAEEWVVKTFICLIGFAVFELVSIVAIDSIPTVDVSMIYVPADLISNGVEPTKTVSHDNVSTSIIHGGFAFLTLFLCASIVVYLFKLGSVSIRFNEGRKQASELVPTIVRLILVFSLFRMIPMGESSALYLVNKYNLEIEHAAQMKDQKSTKQCQAMKTGRQSNHYFLSRLTDLIWITLNPQPATRKVLIVLCKIFNQVNCICLITTAIFAH